MSATDPKRTLGFSRTFGRAVSLRPGGVVWRSEVARACIALRMLKAGVVTTRIVFLQLSCGLWAAEGQDDQLAFFETQIKAYQFEGLGYRSTRRT